MKLKCNKCHNLWEDDVPAGQQMVMCPECMAVVPLLVAQVTSKETIRLRDKEDLTESPASTRIKIAPIGSKEDDLSLMETKPPSKLPAQPPAPGYPSDKESPVMSEQETALEGESDSSAVELSQTKPPGRKPATPMSESLDMVSGELQKTRPPAPKTPSPADNYNILIGKAVDGLKVEKLIGKGGMGAVYLAHQVSLDRKVALKVLPSKFANYPELIARFTREALSAAQLNHHNIVQVYDVGSTEDLNYISMEYVRGKSIGQMIREEGRLQLDDAAGYILQAARGLKYAHERGIIHRDIKPDNLLVNEHGIVKIADMGLAKWRKDIESTKISTEEREALLKQEAMGDLTLANIAMGTPAYMAPEQARDAASVDARADQYSLGCTLYYMCAGKAPYSGTTAFELISKHMNEPLTPLEVHVRGVPPAFKSILERMLQKKPEDRYQSLESVIGELEAYLGVESEKGIYTPREQHLAVLETEQKQYYAAAAIKKRKLSKMIFSLVILLGVVFSLKDGDFILAGGFLGLFILTPFLNFAINGFLTKDYLFRRVRSVFFGMPIKSWFIFTISTLFLLILLHLLGGLGYWIGCAVLAGAVAAAYQLFILKKLRLQRAPAVQKVQDMLKTLRVRGVSEEALQDFCCRFGGQNWEEFFEEFFGYENMIIARGKWAAADKIKPRKKYAIWREPLFRWLEGIEQSRKEAREKRQLEKAEAKRLKAQGIAEKDARKKAEAEATRIMTSYKTIREKDREIPRRISGKRFHYMGFGIRLACALAGILVILASLANVLPKYGIGALLVIQQYVPIAYYSDWGWGGSELAVVSGFMVFCLAFSTRWIFRILALLGLIVLLFGIPIINIINQPQFNMTTAQYGSMGLIAVSFLFNLLSWLQGKRF